MKSYILLVLTLLFLQGCAQVVPTTTFAGTPINDVGDRCDSAIDYKRNLINISGAQVPVLVSGPEDLIKVGKLDLGAEQISESSELIKSIDLLQYTACQDMLFVSSESDRVVLKERKNKLMSLLSQVVKDLDGAKTQQAFTSKIVSAKAELVRINNG